METRCAWCGAVMREGRQPTSHGQCYGCRIEACGDFPELLAAMMAIEHERHDCPTAGMWIDLGVSG